MLIEIIIYITLFTALFSGAFSAAFQTVDTVKYLQIQKNMFDELYFFRAKLDRLVKACPDWENISQDMVTQLISATSSSSNASSTLLVDSFSSETLETATSSSRVLILTIGINKKTYTFSYVKEK